MEALIKILGAILYIIYFIICLLDDSTSTPKEIIVGLQSYESGYYLWITLEYIVLFPLWMLIWNYTLGPFILGAFNKKS